MTQPQPPAGFYPDPSGALQERWWDGTMWTPHTQPFRPPEAAAVPPPTPPGFGPGTAPTGYAFPTIGAPPSTQAPAQWPAQAPGQPGQSPGDALGSLVGSLVTAATTHASQARTTVDQKGVLGAGKDFYRDHQRGVDTVAGGALVAEGLFGLDGPGDTRPGIGGAVKGVVFGLLFAGVALVIGLMLPSGQIAGGVHTSGTVLEVVRGTTSKGAQTCGLEVGYVVDGTEYTTAPGYSSSGLCSKSRGSTVDVVYDPADPAHAAMPTPIGMRLIPWAFLAVGLVIAVISGVQVVLRAAALGTGGWLLWRGLRGGGSARA